MIEEEMSQRRDSEVCRNPGRIEALATDARRCSVVCFFTQASKKRRPPKDGARNGFERIFSLGLLKTAPKVLYPITQNRKRVWQFL
jgi:hypothetical protein